MSRAGHAEFSEVSPEISVVIPCYNEQANAAAIAAAVISALAPISSFFDLIFIDNASTDETVKIIRGLCKNDARIKLIANTRNFGQMRSPTHAVLEARGSAVIGICADFQDPPEMIPEFVARWRAGVDIILGVRESEKTSFAKGLLRKASYIFARKFGDYPIVENATGFGLYDRKVVQAIGSMREPEPFFRGMLVETGYRIETISYARPVRAGGKSANNLFTLIDFALSSLASFSKKIVRLPFFLGVFIGIIGGLTMLGGTIGLLLGKPAWPWVLAGGLEFQVALIFLFLGVMGDQIRLVSERTRKTPLVFESERINFPEGY